MSHLGLVILLFVLMALLGTTYQVMSESGRQKDEVRLAFKGGTTALAGLYALYTYFVHGQDYMLVLSLGIFLCAAADVLLEIKFIWGTACFALGHLFFIASFLLRALPALPSLILFLALLTLSSLVTLLVPGKDKKARLPYYAYSLIISLMVALALAQPPLVFLGAVLFMLSDAIIARRLLFPEKNPWDRACILLYYLAQFVLAISLV